ncbi:MAG: hypothetical protein ABIV63_18655 [Caldimonas sp.]
MASDADWVEDVRRWFLAGRQTDASEPFSVPVGDASDSIGYEAAYPALQAQHWPDAPAPSPRSN